PAARMEAITSAVCASAPGRPQITSSNPEIIMLHRVRPPTLNWSMRARTSASLHGIFGPPVSTWSTPICLRRRMEASSTGSPKPRQIFGVSFPSGGIRENAGGAAAARMGRVAAAAVAPIALRTSLRALMGPPSPVRERPVGPPEDVAASRLGHLSDLGEPLHVRGDPQPRTLVRVHLAVPEIQAFRQVIDGPPAVVVLQHHRPGER